MASLATLKDNLSVRLAGLGSGRVIVRVLGVLVLLILLYYVIGGFWVNRIDDNPDFAPPHPVAGGSHSVDMAVALVERELKHGWTPNDPFFMPGYFLDNMPNYQTGMMAAISRFGTTLAEQLARSRGTSSVDPDVDKASGLLRYPGNVWLWDPGTSLAPTASSESQYRAAVRALESYNKRVAEGTAEFDVRADNLINTLERIINDLGSMSAVIDEHLQEHTSFPISTSVDDIFYQTKGRLYAYYMLLKALGQDFHSVLEEKNLTTVWNQMLESAKAAAEQQPLIILNGGVNSDFVPSHLASQGFLLLRLRTQLREVTSVLQQ